MQNALSLVQASLFGAAVVRLDYPAFKPSISCPTIRSSIIAVGILLLAFAMAAAGQEWICPALREVCLSGVILACRLICGSLIQYMCLDQVARRGCGSVSLRASGFWLIEFGSVQNFGVW